MWYRIKELKHKEFSWFYPQYRYKFTPIWFDFSASSPSGTVRFLVFDKAKEYLNVEITKASAPKWYSV